MTAQVLFFNVFSEKDPHSRKVECVSEYTFFNLKKKNKQKKTRTKKQKKLKKRIFPENRLKTKFAVARFSKMKMTIKNRLHRCDITRPWSIREH